MNGNFTVKQNLGEDIDVNIVGLNFQGGRYRQMIDKTLENFCKSLYKADYKDIFEDYQGHTSNPVAYNTCPYPAESKEVKNYFFKDGSSAFPKYLMCRVMKDGFLNFGF